jgi:hypothetical protein
MPSRRWTHYVVPALLQKRLLGGVFGKYESVMDHSTILGALLQGLTAPREG